MLTTLAIVKLSSLFRHCSKSARRNGAGKFFFEAQAIMPTTMAKFTTTASQYAASRLNPVMRDKSCTDAECLNCAVSCSPEFGSGLGVDEAFAGAFCCEGLGGSSE